MVLRIFGQFLRKGIVFRGDRPIFWSVEGQRVLAEDEMIRSSEIIDCVIMKLPIKRFTKKTKNIQELYPDAKVLVFCSEPWKVTGIKAAGINENIIYVLTKWQNEYLIVAEKRLGELQMRTGHKFKKLLTIIGDSLDQVVLYNPINESDVPILVNNEVTSDFGSGIDCISPAHDLESLKVAYHYGLPKEGYVDEHGKFDDQLGPVYEGLSVLEPKTNKFIADVLREENRLFAQYPYKNEFFSNESTGERIILRSSKSWFLQISDRLKAKCFEELETTKFAPQLNYKESEQAHKDFEKLTKKQQRKGKKKKDEEEIDSYYINLIEELNDFNDWCISDNNKWGIPIPFFTYKDTGDILIDEEIVNHFAQAVEHYGTSDIWYTFDVVDLLPRRYKDECHRLEKGYQVFDSWFDSSLSWNFVDSNCIHENSQVYQDIKNKFIIQNNFQIEQSPRGRGRRGLKSPQREEKTSPVRDIGQENELIEQFPTSMLESVDQAKTI